MDTGTKQKFFKAIIYSFATLVVIMIIIFIVQVVYFSKIIKQKDDSAIPLWESFKQEEQKQISIEGNYWLGSNTPQITIVEFADFACHYSRNLSSKLRDLVFKYPSDIKFIYKDFPVINEWSIPLSLAARCAGEQGAFWDMHDKLFAMQGLVNPENISEVADSLNLELNQFNQCLQNEKYFSEIQKDAKEGESLGVSGTPTIFIDGRIIPGDVSEDILNQLVDEMLKSKNK